MRDPEYLLPTDDPRWRTVKILEADMIPAGMEIQETWWPLEK